jgi:hypothetical protein
MKKTKIDFYEKYREEAQKKLDLWKQLMVIRQELTKLLYYADSFLKTYDTFGDKKSIDTTKK